MRKIQLFIAVLFWGILAAAAPLSAIDPAPMPPDLKIIPPDRNAVPEKLAEFSGVWEGHWIYGANRTQLATFAVERIGKERALVTYSWGDLESGPSIRGGISVSPGWTRIPGCPVDRAEDGNYVITVKTKTATFLLKQTDGKDTIMATRKQIWGMTQDQTNPFSRKK